MPKNADAGLPMPNIEVGNETWPVDEMIEPNSDGSTMATAGFDFLTSAGETPAECARTRPTFTSMGGDAGLDTCQHTQAAQQISTDLI